MSRQEALNRAAQEFLETTNIVYDECATGIARLDRIIVSVHAELAGWTRMLLLASLYAYWERFFVATLGEYLRAISLVGVSCKDSHVALRTLRIKRELLDLASALGINKLHELAEKLSSSEIQALFQDALHWLEAELDFPRPELWIETESNVRFKVLEKRRSDVRVLDRYFVRIREVILEDCFIRKSCCAVVDSVMTLFCCELRLHSRYGCWRRRYLGFCLGFDGHLRRSHRCCRFRIGPRFARWVLCCRRVLRFGTVNDCLLACATKERKVDLRELIVGFSFVELLFYPPAAFDGIFKILIDFFSCRVERGM
jgi:hypothetical protein